jgi:hypothetical protein
MITLTGTLRQSGEVTFGKDKEARTMMKLWVEHESPRDKGPSDLKIEEFFVPVEDSKNLPAKGEPVSVAVRPYASGRGVAYSAISIVAPAQGKPMAKVG